MTERYIHKPSITIGPDGKPLYWDERPIAHARCMEGLADPVPIFSDDTMCTIDFGDLRCHAEFKILGNHRVITKVVLPGGVPLNAFGQAFMDLIPHEGKTYWGDNPVPTLSPNWEPDLMLDLLASQTCKKCNEALVDPSKSIYEQ